MTRLRLPRALSLLAIPLEFQIYPPMFKHVRAPSEVVKGAEMVLVQDTSDAEIAFETNVPILYYYINHLCCSFCLHQARASPQRTEAKVEDVRSTPAADPRESSSTGNPSQNSPEMTTVPAENTGIASAESSPAAVFLHPPIKENCVSCHEKDRGSRPTFMLVHGGKEDCSNCHTADPTALTWLGAKFSHTPAPAYCQECHGGQRPVTPHVQTGDCVDCHTHPAWKSATTAFTHTPKPDSCEACHTRPAQTYLRAYPNQGPPANYTANTDYPGSGHLKGKDCVSCHLTPPEGVAAFSFSHSKPNPGVCLPCHFNKGQQEHNNDANVQLTGFGNCNDCHKNFDKAANRNWGRQ